MTGPAPADPGVVLGAALAAVGVVALGAGPVLRRLPEPAEGEGKPAYAALATAAFVGTCAVLAGLVVTLAGATLPGAVLPLWWVLAVPVLLLAAVDARTTWVPLTLTRVAWAAMAGAGVLSALLGGGWPLLLRAAAGAATAGLLFALLWRVSRGGIGFGDVRLAPLVGAPAGAVDPTTLVMALLLGSLAGAAWGVVRLLRRRPGSFAYAPTMLTGPCLECLRRWLA